MSNLLSLFADVKNIIITGLIGLTVMLYVEVWQKDKTIAKLTQDHLMLKSQCAINAKRYERDLKEYSASVKEAQAQKEEEIKYINNYKGDKNANDCTNADNLLSNYKF